MRRPNRVNYVQKRGHEWDAPSKEKKAWLPGLFWPAFLFLTGCLSFLNGGGVVAWLVNTMEIQEKSQMT